MVRAAWSRFGNRDLDGFLELLDADVEAVPFGAAMEGRSYRGHSGIRAWFEEIYSSWEHFVTQPEEFETVGDQLLVYGRWRAKGRDSGVELDVAATWVVRVRNGKIVHWQTFTERSEALRSLAFDD